MRYVCSTALVAVTLAMSVPSALLGQGGPSLSITNYQLVSEQRFTRTQWYATYKADLVNSGPALPGVTASLTSKVPSVVVVAGQGVLHFGPVPDGGTVASRDTFTILVDRSVPFDFNNLVWSFTNPVANPGPNQSVTVGQTVTLNGSGSLNPSGVGTLTYSWTFVSIPATSRASLQNSNAVSASFVADVAGTYVVQLTVSNGAATDSASVTITTGNSPPWRMPGPIRRSR